MNKKNISIVFETFVTKMIYNKHGVFRMNCTSLNHQVRQENLNKTETQGFTIYA